MIELILYLSVGLFFALVTAWLVDDDEDAIVFGVVMFIGWPISVPICVVIFLITVVRKIRENLRGGK